MQGEWNKSLLRLWTSINLLSWISLIHSAGKVNLQTNEFSSMQTFLYLAQYNRIGIMFLDSPKSSMMRNHVRTLHCAWLLAKSLNYQHSSLGYFWQKEQWPHLIWRPCWSKVAWWVQKNKKEPQPRWRRCDDSAAVPVILFSLLWQILLQQSMHGKKDYRWILLSIW